MKTTTSNAINLGNQAELDILKLTPKSIHFCVSTGKAFIRIKPLLGHKKSELNEGNKGTKNLELSDKGKHYEVSGQT